MKVIQREINILKENLNLGSNVPIPNNILSNFVIEGSKFIRSTISILYLKAQEKDLTDNVFKILSAGELIHSASLLHDDVLDNAETRRGKTVIAKIFSPMISILAGDYLLSKAIEKLLKLENTAILKNFKNCIQKMTESEIKQFFLRENLPTEDDYLEICKGKTAILFATILESSANVLGLDSEKAKTFAEVYGTCFQIKNDMEKESAYVDYKNGIYTAKDVLGIEKTASLLDNY